MTCKFAEYEIQKSLDGALTPDKRERLDAHLASCASCRRAWNEHRRLARVSARWAQPRFQDDPGNAFTAEVMTRIASRSALVPLYHSLWLPLAATILLLVLFAWLPGLLRPSWNALDLAARQTPAWLLTNLHGVPGDAFTTWDLLTAGIRLPSWVWVALPAAAVANGVFCAQAKQARARRSL